MRYRVVKLSPDEPAPATATRATKQMKSKTTFKSPIFAAALAAVSLLQGCSTLAKTSSFNPRKPVPSLALQILSVKATPVLYRPGVIDISMTGKYAKPGSLVSWAVYVTKNTGGEGFLNGVNTAADGSGHFTATYKEHCLSSYTASELAKMTVTVRAFNPSTGRTGEMGNAFSTKLLLCP